MLIVFGFVFYAKVLKGQGVVDLEEKIQLKSIAIAQTASFLPEIECSEGDVRGEGCVDYYKLKKASEIMAAILSFVKGLRHQGSHLD